MKRTVAYGGAAILILISAGVSAQTGGTPIVSVGCINRALQTGSLAAAPGVPPATPDTAQTLANSSEPTNAFLLAGATAADATDAVRAKAAAGQPVTSPATYVLDATRQELERHTGHLMEVTGTLNKVSEGDPKSRATVAHIRVQSLKMLAPACPKPATPK